MYSEASLDDHRRAAHDVISSEQPVARLKAQMVRGVAGRVHRNELSARPTAITSPSLKRWVGSNSGPGPKPYTGTSKRTPSRLAAGA